VIAATIPIFRVKLTGKKKIESADITVNKQINSNNKKSKWK